MKTNNLNYVDNYAPGAETQTMLLYDDIGVDSVTGKGINGASFANQMHYLDSVGTKNIRVLISSPGGNVQDGYAIYSAMRSVKAHITTVNAGMAASTAGWVWLGGDDCLMMDYATFMCHEPNLGDKPTNKEKEALDCIKNSIATIIGNRTGMDIPAVSDLMKKETWMKADDCLANKMITDEEIIKTKVRKPLLDGKTKNEIHAIYNTIINKTMRKFSNTAKNDDDDMENKYKNLQNDYENMKKEHEDLKNKLKNMEEAENKKKKEEEDKKKEKATNLVKLAVTNKVIDETETEEYVSLAIMNYDKVEKMLVPKQFTGISPGTVANILGVATGKTDGIAKNEAGIMTFNGKTFREIDQSDASGNILRNLKNTNEAIWQQLYDSQYKKTA